MDNPKVLIIIPAHNEAASIAGVIDDIRSSLAAGIVVIDDGSSDDTARIAIEAGVEVLTLPFNLGIGSAMQTGYQFAEREGYDIAVQTDGDGQHKASHIPELLEPILQGESNMVVGSRYLAPESYSGSMGRRAGTALFSRLLSLMLRQRLTDATSGFRALDRQLIELFAHDYPRDYPEVEALLTTHMARLRIKEVPVTMRPRGGGRSSINNFRSVYYMVKVLLALMVVMSRRRAPQTRQEATPR
jgi:hypothetical protein